MRVTILNVAYEHVPNNKGGYGKLDVAYKNEQGKTEGKKVMSFTNEVVFNTLRGAKQGDVFDVSLAKDNNNYWQWTEVTPVYGTGEPTGAPAQAQEATTVPRGTPSPKSTYETPEERAIRRSFEEKKHHVITRLASVNSAIEYAKNVKAVKTEEELFALAERIESFALYGANGGFKDMPDDTDGII